MPFFSVIIPIYNLENYIYDCVNSIFAQTFNDYEILLIDDGSKDNSLKICDNISKNDNRVKVIHKENGGASAARNVGIRESKGKYVIFVDGDDFFSDYSAFEKLHRKIINNDYDVVSYNRNCFDESTMKICDCSDYRNEIDNELSFNDFVRTMIKNDYFYGAVWVLCVNRELIINNELFFIEGTATEDLDWIIKLLNLQPTIYNLEDVLYTYRSGRVGSVTRSVNYKRQKEYGIMIRNLANYSYYSDEFRELIFNYLAYNFVLFCSWNQQIDNKDQKKDLISMEKDLRFLLKYDLMTQTKIANIMSKIFGYRITDKLLGVALRRKL